MSRHSCRPRADRPDIFEVALGWDRPLQSFFVIAFGAPDSDGEPQVIAWRGTYPNELPEPADMLHIAVQFAQIPDDLPATLEIDRLKTSASVDGVNQRAAKDWIDRQRPLS